jgi:hypothetical protein
VNEYVTASYGVILFALLLYVVIVGLRSARLARETELLARLVEREEADRDETPTDLAAR